MPGLLLPMALGIMEEPPLRAGENRVHMLVPGARSRPGAPGRAEEAVWGFRGRGTQENPSLDPATAVSMSGLKSALPQVKDKCQEKPRHPSVQTDQQGPRLGVWGMPWSQEAELRASTGPRQLPGPWEGRVSDPLPAPGLSFPIYMLKDLVSVISGDVMVKPIFPEKTAWGPEGRRWRVGSRLGPEPPPLRTRSPH